MQESIAPAIRSSGQEFPETCRCRFRELRGKSFQQSTTKMLRHLSLHSLNIFKKFSSGLVSLSGQFCSPDLLRPSSFHALEVPASHVPLLFMGPLSRLLLFRSPLLETQLHTLTQADRRHKCTISQVVRPLQATRIRLTSLPARVK